MMMPMQFMGLREDEAKQMMSSSITRRSFSLSVRFTTMKEFVSIFPFDKFLCWRETLIELLINC